MRDTVSVHRAGCRSWRAFDPRLGRRIELELRVGETPCCPLCGVLLEARPTTRFRDHLVLDARGFDLDCRACRRFWCIVQHTPRSVRLLRMRRLLAAVRAAGGPAGSKSGRRTYSADPALA